MFALLTFEPVLASFGFLFLDFEPDLGEWGDVGMLGFEYWLSFSDSEPELSKYVCELFALYKLDWWCCCCKAAAAAAAAATEAATEAADWARLGVDELTGSSESLLPFPLKPRPLLLELLPPFVLESELLFGDVCSRLFCWCRWCTAFRNELAYEG